MSNRINISIKGTVGTPISLYKTKTGNTMARFRVVSTPRYRERDTGVWRDAPSEWFTVKLWGKMASHASRSLLVGHPVTITGFYSTERWVPEGQTQYRTISVITATSLGHDLSRGVSAFTRPDPGPAEAAVAGGRGEAEQRREPGVGHEAAAGQAGEPGPEATEGDEPSREERDAVEVARSLVKISSRNGEDTWSANEREPALAGV